MLKLNVGLNRKVGEANFGSRGASVNLELELEGGLVGDPDRLKERIRQLFVLAKASVDEELNGQTLPASDQHNGNGHAQCGNGNGHGNGHSSQRLATASQARAIRAIAGRQRFDLEQLLGNRFGIARPEDLSISDASSLIDELKSPVNGQGGRR